MTPYERHVHDNPAATISEAEYNWLQHISRFGSSAYPISKLGRKWQFGKMFNAGGCPVLLNTKREAVERLERFYSDLLDKNAGREVGTTQARREAEAAARAQDGVVS